VRFGDWMKKNFTPKQIKMMKNDPLTPKGLWTAEMKSWYMYFGDVPLSKIRAVEYADPKEKAPLTKLASPQGVKTAAEGF